ncbi:MAG TPA: hypothetical protein VFP53_06150 [Sphingomicrobium sp.]|nr:hypothetical protein [Sphingomicrobium sp.]
MLSFPSGFSLKLVAAIGCALLLALLLHDRNHWKARSEHTAALLAAEQSAHAATVANYRAAAERARLLDAENLARARAEQAAINERTVNEFESRIAAARARADKLRRQARSAQSGPGAGGTAPVPAIPASAAGTVEATGEDRLPRSDRLIATEQAIQLDELIDWVRSQNRIDPDGR